MTYWAIYTWRSVNGQRNAQYIRDSVMAWQLRNVILPAIEERIV